MYEGSIKPIYQIWTDFNGYLKDWVEKANRSLGCDTPTPHVCYSPACFAIKCTEIHYLRNSLWKVTMKVLCPSVRSRRGGNCKLALGILGVKD